jgi:hypothetical protein
MAEGCYEQLDLAVRRRSVPSTVAFGPMTMRGMRLAPEMVPCGFSDQDAAAHHHLAPTVLSPCTVWIRAADLGLL